MVRYVFAAVLAVVAAAQPAAAQSGLWRHAETGISLPRSIGEMSLSREQDASGGENYDVILQYGSSQTPVTLYIYRSAYPNAAIWFERTRLAMNQNVGADAVTVAPRSFALGGASTPNGLREEITLPNGAATGVAIAQIGEWIVKIRVTSTQLDRAGVAARMDSLLGSLQFSNSTPAPHPLIVPGPCGDGATMRGEQLRNLNSRNYAAAAAASILGYGAARGIGGLAAEPALWCRATQTAIPVQLGSLYRRIDGSGWVALLGDSGRAAAALLNPVPGNVRAVLFASLPASTHVVAAYDGIPDPDQGVSVALPVVVGQATGIAQMGTEPARRPGGRKD